MEQLETPSQNRWNRISMTENSRDERPSPLPAARRLTSMSNRQDPFLDFESGSSRPGGGDGPAGAHPSLEEEGASTRFPSSTRSASTTMPCCTRWST